MKKILPLSALAFFLLIPVSFAAENTTDNTSSPSVLSDQIEVVGAQETDLVTENEDVSDNEDINDEEKGNDRELDKDEKNNHKDDNDEEEIILFLVGALSGFLGLAFGAGGTLFYLRKKNNK